MATTSAQVPSSAIHSNNRRRGWVIASEDGTEVERPSSFDARKSAAAWNKGKGPSQASIPSRASSLASTPAPSPALISEAFPPAPAAAPTSTPAPAPAPTSAPAPATATLPSTVDSVPNANSTSNQPVPPPREARSSMGHSKDASASTTSEAESSTGRRRPSPPLLVPPKQTFRKVPSTKVLPPSALSDHQKFMSAASRSSGSASSSVASSSKAGPSGSRAPFVTAALRSDLAKLAASRRANSSSSSSAATSSSAETIGASATTAATSTAPTTQHDYKGKGKQTAQSPLQTDSEGFFSSGGKVKQLVNNYDNGHARQWSGEKQSTAGTSTSSQQAQPKLSHITLAHPLPPLSEKSANSDVDDALSSASELPSDSEASSVAKPAKRRESLQIELPPPPPQFKDRYPSILVDSTHASDSEASGTSNGGPRRRRRRSTASTNRLGGDGEDDDDEEYADDDSSWPSTPSTTPLEMYFTSADADADANANASEARPRAARRTVQTTKEIITPVPDALGMGRPMVVVTSPSTASEVSSDRRSSSGSGSTSTYSSSPPAVASIAPAPALSKIEEHPNTKPDTEAFTAAASKTSLSFEVPEVPRSRASQESLQGAGPVRSPSRTRAFLAKISPSRSANRSSVDLPSTAQIATPAEVAKRMSLDSQRRTSGEQRRSVELRPILLNAASRPPPRPATGDQAIASPAVAISTASAQQAQQQRRSSGRVAIRPNVVPYHSRRSSEVSVGSSTDSPHLLDRGSFDRDACDPRYSPSSQVTTFTMPSPALSNTPKLYPSQQVKAVHLPVEAEARRSSAANSPRDRFAASMPSLHEPSQGVHPSTRRAGSHEEAESRPSAIRLLVDSQKGRMSRDNDSIAEWISVSVNDLPLPGVKQAYGNGGAGEFSNENQQHGKKGKKTKPWKLGRFAASEVVLPSKSQPKRRSFALAKRSSSAQVNDTENTGDDSMSSPQKVPFMRNLGFTTANRNVVLQNLCAERSISALGASTIYIAGCGRINVPQPSVLPGVKGKGKLQVCKEKRQSKSSDKKAAAAVAEEPIVSVRPSHSADASEDAHLNVTEHRHSGYGLDGTGVNTVKSMVPELGDWSASSGHDVGHSEERMDVQPFRDYEDEGSDLFDSDRSESKSEDEMDYEEDDDEEVEVPVRFGQRVNLANRYSSQSTNETPAASNASATDSQVRPSISLERLTPGTVMLHRNELRICVEQEELASRTARPMAYWKAVEVQPSKPQEEAAEQQVRRQPSSRAMKLEEEVATGIFAAFVGNRSPRRQNQRSSFDAEGGSPTKRGAQSTGVVSKELVVSKVNGVTFSVRSETRSTMEGTEQMVEILRRHGAHGSSHVSQASGSSKASTPMDKLERAFPSPLLSNGDFAHNRSRSNRAEGSLSTIDDAVERITMRIQQMGGRGFAATFTTREGQQWYWQGSKLEASVLSPRKDPSEAQGLDVLEGYDLVLRASNGSQTVELATYSTESQVRNALGLFKPRTKSVPKPLPEDVSSIGPVVPPPARVLPLAIPIRGVPGPMGREEPQIPMRGIRGGPLLRRQPTVIGSPHQHQHALWQHQRAAISNEVVVQVHNNAVNNARASLLLNDRSGGSRTAVAARGSVEVDRSRTSEEVSGDKKMGMLSFSVGSLDRDLVVLSLLAVMGSVRV